MMSSQICLGRLQGLWYHHIRLDLKLGENITILNITITILLLFFLLVRDKKMKNVAIYN